MTSGSRSTNTSHLLLFLAALGGILIALFGILLFAGLAALAAASGDAEGAWLPLWTVAGLVVLIGALLPGLYWFGRAAFGGTVPLPRRPAAGWLALLVLYPVCLAAGGLAFAESGTAGLAGVVALIGTSALPVAAIVWLVRRLGPPLTPTRAWGHFTIGLTGMPFVALIVEFVAILPVVLVVGLWLLQSPEVLELFALSDPTAIPDPEALTDIAGRMLTSPLALAATYGYLALVIPIVEEVIKTMAVWPFLRRGLSPAEAFLGGALGGAGYALFEALFLTQPGEAWLALTIARAGATLLHVFTAALTSWGLIEGVRRRRYGVAAGTFLVAVAMHAAWNAAAVTIGIESVPVEAPSATLSGLAALSPALLAGLVVLSAVGLTAGWRRLSTETAEPSA